VSGGKHGRAIVGLAVACVASLALDRVAYDHLAYIGVYEHEKRYEQRVLISADLWVRDDYDGTSDRLADVLDYGKVVDDIVMLVEREHVNLIETMAERNARQCLSDGRVQRVRVSIAKPDVTKSCKSVGIEIEREQEASDPPV
jgi:dihydroneopterin aldolase